MFSNSSIRFYILKRSRHATSCRRVSTDLKVITRLDGRVRTTARNEKEKNRLQIRFEFFFFFFTTQVRVAKFKVTNKPQISGLHNTET